MSAPVFIAVTPETHAVFVTLQDALGLSSDALVRRLLGFEADGGDGADDEAAGLVK